MLCTKTVSRHIPSPALEALVHALLDRLPQDQSPVVAIVKPESGLPKVPSTNEGSPSTTAYNPAVVYILEVATMLVVRNKDTTAALGKEVVEALQDTVRDTKSSHPLVVSRAALYLLTLLSASHVSFTHISWKFC
jgi:brefeldin A-resistance guanine nucleotide exchange factor 1